MMETEAPRHAPPSRYKTVRRKPTISSSLQPSHSHPHPHPHPQQFKEAPREPQPTVQQQSPQRPLIDLASHTKYQDTDVARPQHHLQRHESKFRKILRLNTSTKEHSPPPSRSQPATETSAVLSHREQGKLAKSPERAQIQDLKSEEDIRKQQARDEAVAKLEGKSTKRRSRSDNLAQDTVYDLKVTLHHDKHKPTIVPILNGTDAGALLEKVRPGHDRCLLESWPSLGIRRQVRYFELVTDVVNTWDMGASSHLRLGKNVWGQSNTKLEQFSKSEPTMGESLFYYYVTADKKWSKRTVSAGNGTLKIVKKDKPYDKDYMQTINLDNFDIYSFVDPFSPNSKLRCPTRYCFALKSQHKQSLFGKNSVFVHYFAIEDRLLFTNWYNSIGLAKARLMAEKRRIAPWIAAADDGFLSQDDELVNPFADGSPTSPPRGRRLPKPLLSPEELAQPPSASTDMQRSKSLHHSKTIKRGNDRSASANTPTGLVGNLRQEVFSPGGLLGSDYEEKKRLALLHFKDERAKDALLQSKSTAMRNDAPLQSGSQHHHKNHHQYQPLVSPDTSPVDQRSPTMSSHTSEPHVLQHRGTTSNRLSTSGNKEPGTLLNFGADEINARLPHHHQARSRAHTIADREVRGNGGLIELVPAKPGEDGYVPVPMIPNTPLTRRPTTAKSKKLGYTSEEEYKPFTGTGLLARDFQSAGTAAHGHGVKTGRDAVTKNGEINPLMDMNQKSLFAPGSLLGRRERETGPSRPIIDRDPHSSDSD